MGFHWIFVWRQRNGAISLVQTAGYQCLAVFRLADTKFAFQIFDTSYPLISLVAINIDLERMVVLFKSSHLGIEPVTSRVSKRTTVAIVFTK